MTEAASGSSLWAGRIKMIGFPGMRGVKAVTGVAASVLLLGFMGPMPALADTIEAALVRALEQPLKRTKDRFNFGELTRTDVAQSEAQLAAGKTQQLTAESQLTTTRSNFRRIIGNEPEALAPGSPVDRYLPGTLPGAVDLSLIENPNVTAAMFGIDVNFLQVKVNEGALLPTLSLQVGVQQASEQQMTVNRTFGASAIA